MRVIFAGGGTGGHINPAISIADYLRKADEDFEALFIGTKRGLETKLVPAAGYDIKYIDIQGFDRKNLLKNFSVAAKLVKANAECVKIVKEFKPDAIVCTGGYVSGPVAIAAKKCRVPAIIHEQNVYPGMTVKGSQRYVDYVAVSFAETINHMSHKDKCVVTGNPIREEILAADKQKCREKLGISDDEKLVLIFGGSLGAPRINEAVAGLIPKVAGSNIRILFGTGERNYKSVMERIGDVPSNVTVTPYINNMAEVMAAADLAVTRSGAITVSELACLNKPAILIPSPNVVRNHQEQNAKEFEDANAAVMLRESELSPESLYTAITSLVSDDAKLVEMANNMESFAKRDALLEIAELVYKLRG
ncbi:MAG: undecaprenyldiphospho-muramoylpentapeptide beta-N-acetylglucosaminyltransferase [Eubacteriales bacterium]|nr:undecaprenyldiphospho-muramoylpentapeptide beta-N-acetylglucosaminyltransferase [Eubacteriales bacterium]